MESTDKPSEQLKAGFEAAAAPILAMREAFRQALEKSLAESRAAFERAKTAAGETAGAIESSASTASKGTLDFNIKALEALRANAEANFDFLKAVINAKSIGEAASLQTDHARAQAEALAAQARDFAALAQKVAAESAEPLKARLAKSFKLSA
ncbi:MAG TPA: phasin family protein [Roseiarcus sp.]|jgi:phasin|nr:phasin family protein [Roseiarcus sp.]